MKPKASIIVPAYNAEKFISETLKSVRKQTVPLSDFELILINDGSTDNTSEIIEREIFGMNNFLFLNRDKNLGQAASTNQGINSSSGKYIILLDADDLLEPNAVESTLRFMERNPRVEYSYSRHRRIDEKGNFLENRPGYSFSLERLFHFNFVGHLKCFSREIHDRLGGFNEEIIYAQDWEHVLSASEILRKGQISQNSEYLYLYRFYQGNSSTVKNEERKLFVSRFLTEHLAKRKIGANVFWSHMTKDKYNYFDWKLKKSENVNSFFGEEILKERDLAGEE